MVFLALEISSRINLTTCMRSHALFVPDTCEGVPVQVLIHLMYMRKKNITFCTSTSYRSKYFLKSANVSSGASA